MAWHGGSQFAHPTHFRPMDRNSRRIWHAKLDLAKRRRLITGQAHAVGRELLAHHGPTGRCDPTHARLAEVAGCCERTVRNALQQLAGLGLVTWTRRLMRTAAGSRQTSSAFRLMLADIAQAARRMVKSPGGKICRGTHPFGILDLEAASAAPTMDHDEAAEALRRIREARSGIVNPPRPTQQEAAQSLAEIRKARAQALADAIAQHRAKVGR